MSTHYTFELKNTSLNPQEVKKFTEICKREADYFRKEIASKEFPAIDAIFDDEDLHRITKLANKISSHQKVLVLGVGGSSLGGKTLSALKFQDKIEFLESIDPETVKHSLKKIDLESTFFLVISKSGETIETICQTLILIDELQKKKIKDFASRFLFITESDKNSLAKIAKKINAEITAHNPKIGGRYSCFSITGLLPSAIAGVDIKKVRLGAKSVLERFLKHDEIVDSCAVQLALYYQGFRNNVIMPYIDNLKNFTDWYRQLWAESLGKNGFGSTPINSMGTVDQHSQLQLYLDGTKDKFFTFLVQKKPAADFLIHDLELCHTLFGGKKLSEIVRIEQETTIETLNQKKLPIRIFTIEKLEEEALGGLMMQMFLETILIAKSQVINPFDQPAVEFRKELAKKILTDFGSKH